MNAVVGAATDVAVRGKGEGIGEFVRRVRPALKSDVLAVAPDRPVAFDADLDKWVITDGDGTTRAVDVIIDSAEAPHRRGLLDESDSRRRFGEHRYLGVARHGFPNYFVVTDRMSGRYAARCVQTLVERRCTRVEVRGHAQAQASRNIDGRREHLNPVIGKRPRLSDFEFTCRDDREEGEDYRGPAVLHDADGGNVDVEIHILAVFQPIDNAIRWSGRILPTPVLASLHRTVNQPVTLTIGSNPPVPGLLVDQDPWGGSRIVGAGSCPYPLPLLKELAESSDT